MELTVGEVLEGKVTGIAKFGAFVALDGGRSGLVHISEVANTYVSDVNEYLKVGQTVKVKVIVRERLALFGREAVKLDHLFFALIRRAHRSADVFARPAGGDFL